MKKRKVLSDPLGPQGGAESADRLRFVSLEPDTVLHCYTQNGADMGLVHRAVCLHILQLL